MPLIFSFFQINVPSPEMERDQILSEMSHTIATVQEGLERMNVLHQQYYYHRFFSLLHENPLRDFFFPFFEGSWFSRTIEAEMGPLREGTFILQGCPVVVYPLPFVSNRLRSTPPLYWTGIWNERTITMAGQEWIPGLRNPVDGLLGDYDEVAIASVHHVEPHTIWIAASCHGNEGYPVYTEEDPDVDNDNDHDNDNDQDHDHDNDHDNDHVDGNRR